MGFEQQNGALSMAKDPSPIARLVRKIYTCTGTFLRGIYPRWLFCGCGYMSRREWGWVPKLTEHHIEDFHVGPM
jgi:hypothetical protein